VDEKLTTFDGRVLFMAPELYSILHLLGSPRPFDQASVVSAWDLWKALDDKRASEVTGWGFVLQRLFDVVPPGLPYPKKPLWRLAHCKRTAYLKRFRDFHLKKRIPLPEFFKKIDAKHIEIAVQAAQTAIQEVSTWQ
jgi:hypothetical protein